MKVAERSFEEAIECALLEGGPGACAADALTVRETLAPYGRGGAPGGYRRRRPEDYDRGLWLLPADVIDFLLATQPKEWEQLRQHYGTDVKERFLARLSREIGRRGALDVLRNGIKDCGCSFRLAYFWPAEGSTSSSSVSMPRTYSAWSDSSATGRTRRRASTSSCS